MRQKLHSARSVLPTCCIIVTSSPLQCKDLSECVAGCRGPEEADAESVRTAVLLDELDFPGALAVIRLHPQPSKSCCAAQSARNQCKSFYMASGQSYEVTWSTCVFLRARVLLALLCLCDWSC